jgi:hypothetical protein
MQTNEEFKVKWPYVIEHKFISTTWKIMSQLLYFKIF